MKVSTLQVVATAMPMILPGPARAGFVGITVQQLPMDEFPGVLTWRIYAQFDGTQGQGGGDFVFAMAGTPQSPMNVHVRAGRFFQHPANMHAGGDLSPDPALCGADSTVCRDSFVTIGKDTATGDVTMLAPDWPGFGPDALEGPGDGPQWYIIPEAEQGLPDRDNRVLAMQLSTADGAGFYGSGIVGGFSDGFAFQTFFEFDTGCRTDLDADGLVGLRDLLVVIAQWGPCPPDCPGDVSANGEVGIHDLLEVLAEWGPCE